jgi:serine/threonine protein kinase
MSRRFGGSENGMSGHDDSRDGIDSVIELEAQPEAIERSERGMRLVHIEEFESPVALDGEQRDAYLRRFVTLFVDEAHVRRGGIGRVARATNAMGEAFALKTLVLPERVDSTDDEEYERHAESLKRAFRQEYECHRALSGLAGFPRLYGFGLVDGAPAIVMEWIEGQTLAQACRLLAADDEGRVPPLTAARIGRDLFDLLMRMDLIQDGMVHRDVSMGNVMVRTSRLSVLEQADEGAFELCLVDFGSSASMDEGVSFTRQNMVARKATANYAPPEMLTDDVPDLERLRKSPAIDVYAAASVVYHLACGRPPFDLVGADSDEAVSPYRVKTEQEPAVPVMAHNPAADLDAVLLHEPEVAVMVERSAGGMSSRPDAEDVRDALDYVDAQLAELLAKCLAVPQGARPTARQMHGALSAFCRQYAENVERSLAGEPLLPCMLDGEPQGSAVSAMELRAIVKAAAKAASAAVWIIVVCATGLLAHGAHISFGLGPLAWAGSVNGAVVSAALAVPGVLGFLGRWRDSGTFRGFVRGSAFLALGALAGVAALLSISTESLGVWRGLAAALFAAVAAGWCPLVVDYTLAVALPTPRKPKRTGLPEGEDDKTLALEAPAGLAKIDEAASGHSTSVAAPSHDDSSQTYESLQDDETSQDGDAPQTGKDES